MSFFVTKFKMFKTSIACNRGELLLEINVTQLVAASVWDRRQHAPNVWLVGDQIHPAHCSMVRHRAKVNHYEEV